MFLFSYHRDEITRQFRRMFLISAVFIFFIQCIGLAFIRGYSVSLGFICLIDSCQGNCSSGYLKIKIRSKSETKSKSAAQKWFTSCPKEIRAFLRETISKAPYSGFRQGYTSDIYLIYNNIRYTLFAVR